MSAIYKDGAWYGKGGSGSEYTAGDGIVIENDEISTDNMSSEDMSEVASPMPSVMSRLPILFDEIENERVVGLYRNSDGTKKNVYEKSIKINDTFSSAGGVKYLQKNTNISADKVLSQSGYFTLSGRPIVFGSSEFNWQDTPSFMSYATVKNNMAYLFISIRSDDYTDSSTQGIVTIQYTKTTD